MALPFLRAWREERLLKRRAATYVRSLAAEPGAPEVEWLARVVTAGDADRARWELRYARRALGLVVASRDALDDRTASAVAHELASALRRDPNVAADKLALAEQQFNARIRVYAEALASRDSGETTAARVGRALIRAAGGPPQADTTLVARAGDLLGHYLTEANESLRQAFGTAELPEDVAPSEAARTRALEPR